MGRIFIDECGYTGENLLDRQQRVFAICTHAMSEEDCARIKAKYFGAVQAKELKHSELSKRPAQQAMLLSALTDLVKNHQTSFKLYFAHKEFCLMMKIVDLVIETSAHEAGFDLYERGGVKALSNVLYACMSLDAAYRRRLLETFQAAIRERTAEAQAAFLTVLKEPHAIAPVDECRTMILNPLKHIGFAGVFNGLGKNALDLSFALAYHLVGAWRMELGSAGFEVVHDQSSNMAKQRELWDALVSPTAPAALVGRGAYAIEYPLCVKSTEFSSSVESPALQIADIVAGATARLYSSLLTDQNDDYAEGLQALVDDWFPGYWLWPQKSIEPDPPAPPGAPQPVDPLIYTMAVKARLKKE